MTLTQEVYYDNPGLRPREITNKTYPEIADVLFNRLATLQRQMSRLTEKDWKSEFAEKCRVEHEAQEAQWEADWLTLCDGKRFLRDLHNTFGVRASPLRFKKMIVERMQSEQADSWVLVNQLLSDALRVA